MPILGRKTTVVQLLFPLLRQRSLYDGFFLFASITGGRWEAAMKYFGNFEGFFSSIESFVW